MNTNIVINNSTSNNTVFKTLDILESFINTDNNTLDLDFINNTIMSSPDIPSSSKDYSKYLINQCINNNNNKVSIKRIKCYINSLITGLRIKLSPDIESRKWFNNLVANM